MFLISRSRLRALLRAQFSGDVLALSVRKATKWGEFCPQRPCRSMYRWLWLRLKFLLEYSMNYLRITALLASTDCFTLPRCNKYPADSKGNETFAEQNCLNWLKMLMYGFRIKTMIAWSAPLKNIEEWTISPSGINAYDNLLQVRNSSARYHTLPWVLHRQAQWETLWEVQQHRQILGKEMKN